MARARALLRFGEGKGVFFAMSGKEGAPKDGSLRLPVDIFELIFHLMPTILVILKMIRDRAQGS
jgi:hypothetical protein